VAVRERIIRFGENGRLVGMLATPGGSFASTAVLFFNAGIVHRVGAHRFNVKLARLLAARGAPSMRFDLSGLGDSAAAPPGQGFEAQAIADIRAAIDAFAAALARPARFAAIGMCSGADNAWRAALADERLAALVLLDPYAYENRRAKLQRMAAKAADPERWGRALGRLGRQDSLGQRPEEADASRPFPARAEFGAGLQSLTRRGVDMLILYTRFVEEQLARPEHFFDTFRDFDFNGRIEVGVDRGVDHTYTELSAQKAVFGRIADWLLGPRS